MNFGASMLKKCMLELDRLVFSVSESQKLNSMLWLKWTRIYKDPRKVFKIRNCEFLDYLE